MAGRWRWAAVAAAAVCAGGNAVLAAAGPDAASSAPVIAVQDENASVSSARLTDRNYVNGLRLSYTSALGEVPDALQGVGRAVWSDGATRIAVDLSQTMFTPADTKAAKAAPSDRPYAGLLLGTLALLRDVPDSRSTLALSLGMAGPAALAEQVQNGWHDVIRQPHVNGWHSQLHDEPALELSSGRVWRLPTGSLGGLETDAMPQLAVGLGNVKIFAQTGVTLRLGQGLMSDYGVARIRPGATGGDAFEPVRPFAWYVFAGVDGAGVMRDITLDGNDFRGGPSVKLHPFVGELTGGLAVMAAGARLTYTHAIQTQEYVHQRGGLHQTGALALSVRF